MKKEHISGIEALEKECFANPWNRRDIEAQLKNINAHFLAAVSEKEVIGYLGIYEYFESCEMANLAVSAPYRRQGIARALVEKAIESAVFRGCDYITLEVRKSNAPALNLYHSMSFEQAGLRKSFYTNPEEDAIIMTKYFKEKK
jgi:ribosomal-protein-alanine N-acetyltransferase